MDKNKAIRDVVDGIANVVGIIGVCELIGAFFGVRMPIGGYFARRHQERVNEQRIRLAEIKYSNERAREDISDECDQLEGEES